MKNIQIFICTLFNEFVYLNILICSRFSFDTSQHKVHSLAARSAEPRISRSTPELPQWSRLRRSWAREDVLPARPSRNYLLGPLQAAAELCAVDIINTIVLLYVQIVLSFKYITKYERYRIEEWWHCCPRSYFIIGLLKYQTVSYISRWSSASKLIYNVHRWLTSNLSCSYCIVSSSLLGGFNWPGVSSGASTVIVGVPVLLCNVSRNSKLYLCS